MSYLAEGLNTRRQCAENKNHNSCLPTFGVIALVLKPSYNELFYKDVSVYMYFFLCFQWRCERKRFYSYTWYEGHNLAGGEANP